MCPRGRCSRGEIALRLPRAAVSVWVPPLPEALPIEPGAEASVEVTVRNDSEIVDEYALQLLGDAGQWSAVEPERLQLMPGTAAAVRVTFRPPRDASLAPGPRPIGLKVASLERPDTSSVVEGMLDVKPFEALSVDLFPRTSHGSSGGKHEVAIDNRGNNRLQVHLNASDPDNVLRFRFSPPVVDSEPGTASFARLRVRHKRRFLRGPSRLRPFTVFVERGEDEPPLSTNGTAVQEQLFPTWALGALVGLAALALLWGFVLTPEVEDTAKNAADKQALHVLVNAGQTTPTDTNGNGSQNGTGSGKQNGNGNSN